MKSELGEWRPVVGYEGLYEVSSLGEIRSFPNIRHKKIKYLKLRKNIKGYLQIGLGSAKNRKTIKIHRLVAEAFIPNPDGLPCVNHKDEDKTNNRAENLEWCTYLYNTRYGTGIERSSKAKTNGKCSKPVLQYTLEGEFVREYPSTREADRVFGFRVHDHIIECCKGKRNTSHGYIWRYKISNKCQN